MLWLCYLRSIFMCFQIKSIEYSRKKYAHCTATHTLCRLTCVEEYCDILTEDETVAGGRLDQIR